VLGASYGSIPIGAALFAALTAMSFADAFDRPFALVFWVDAASFLVSFLFIARLHQLRAPVGEVTTPDKVRFRDAFRIPLVRAVMPAAAAVAFGLGALFSMGIVFVRVVVDAGDVDFGVLIALFGVGAAGGLLVLRARVGHDPVRETRAGVLAIGVIVAAFSLTASIGLAFVGALLFGGAAAFTLASGMGALQSDLEGHERVLAFAAFHVVIRLALGVAAVAAGLVGEALGDADAGVIGSLEPARVVLLASGLLVLLASLSVRAEQGSTVSA